MNRYYDLSYDDDRSLAAFFLSSILKARVQHDEDLGQQEGADEVAHYLAELLLQLTTFPHASRWIGYIPDSNTVSMKVKAAKGNIQRFIMLQTNADVRFIWSTIFQHQPHFTRYNRFQNPRDIDRELGLARELYWAASEYVGRSQGAGSHKLVLRLMAEKFFDYSAVMRCLSDDVWSFIPPLSPDDQRSLFGY